MNKSSIGTINFITPDFNPGDNSNNSFSEFHRNDPFINQNKKEIIHADKCPEPTALFDQERYQMRWTKVHPYKMLRAYGSKLLYLSNKVVWLPPEIVETTLHFV